MFYCRFARMLREAGLAHDRLYATDAHFAAYVMHRSSARGLLV